MSIDLRLGSYLDVMQDVECDLCCADPPYGASTHAGQRHGRKDGRYCDPNINPLLSARGLAYAHWTEDDVREFVDFWHPRTRGWICCFTSSDLIGAWKAAFLAVGRYPYAPVSCVQHAMNVRLAGDGPSNWTTYLVRAKVREPFAHHLFVARPKWRQRWGTLPGAYNGTPFDLGENALDRSKRVVAGGKPLWLMQRIVEAYSRPGSLVCDPTAGGATSLMAAVMAGRRAIGSERDPATHAKAIARLQTFERDRANAARQEGLPL